MSEQDLNSGDNKVIKLHPARDNNSLEASPSRSLKLSISISNILQQQK